jgi:hypothetical protein
MLSKKKIKGCGLGLILQNNVSNRKWTSDMAHGMWKYGSDIVGVQEIRRDNGHAEEIEDYTFF